jgi:hypothetical protein
MVPYMATTLPPAAFTSFSSAAAADAERTIALAAEVG